MKTTTTHNALKLIAAIVMTATASSAYATISTSSQSECYFVSQLKDPVTRMEFVTKLQLAKQTPDLLTGIPSRDGEQFLVQIMDESGRPAEVDQFSFDCMSCHDGLSAAAHSSRVKSASADGSVNMRGSHPIGMD
uniref:hypothetical protein n=1 Tax=Salmonella enterica TaxID=28901 RepID=UPI003525EE1F